MFYGNSYINVLYYYTLEPLNKGHVGASHFVLCRELVRSSEIKNVLTIWENENLGPRRVSFVERLFLMCPPLGGSLIGGSSTVLIIGI